MRTGHRYPIDEFERAARLDLDVVGVLLTGSVGVGAGDAWSDLDFELVFAAAVADPKRRAEHLCEALGQVHFAYWRGDLLTAFVGATWQRVDVRVVARDAFAPAPGYAGARVLKDVDGSIADVVHRSSRPRPAVDTADAYQELACAIDSQIYTALHTARGALWSALGELVFRQGQLYRLLARLRGVEAFGLRHAESVLRVDERAALVPCWPSQPQPDELRRAARALWSFTQLVRAAVASELGTSAVPEVDEARLLAAVDAIHRR